MNTIEVLAQAFAAYRINKGHVQDTRRFSEDTPTQFSQKDMLAMSLTEHKDRVPEDFKFFKFNDQDMIDAVDAVKFVNKDTALKQIAGTLSDYMQNLVSCINAKEISNLEFGIVAVLPKIYFETRHKKEYKKKIKTEFGESKHIGIPGTVVQGDFCINEIKFVEKFGCHVLNGTIETNLVSFFKNFEAGKELPEANSTVKIKGKVKRHGENFVTKLPETQLNYVKIFK